MYRVLIVDDEVPFLQSLMKFDWETNDCRCVGQATNGQEALEKCIGLAPHIVITDINMPVVDGLSFLATLHERCPEIQVILLTVHRDFDYAQKAIKLGACDYLVKDMDFRLQLPAVLEKAKQIFEQQPAKLNNRARLLHKSGHMLVIESEDLLHAYPEEVERFLNQYAGTLITAKLPQQYDSLHSLISKLDSLPDTVGANVGLIVRSKDCFELLTEQQIHNAESQLRQTLAEKWPHHISINAHFALTPCGEKIQHYIDAHNINSLMLERGFYAPQPPIVTSKNTEFKPLSQSAVNEWIRRAELLYNDDGKLEKYIHEIAAEAARSYYSPTAVRGAFDQLLYKYELRYAASSDEKAHAFLLDARDIASLAEKLFETIKQLASGQSCYSFIINRATEYINAHIGDQELQLNDAAEFVRISPGYLSKKMKEETGQTFQELLIRLRMEYAAKILKNSDKKIYEIAEMVGYKNYRSFAAVFTDHFGISPKKYIRG